LNPFVPNNTNVPTINPNACDRNNLNPNVRPIFWDTYFLGENVCMYSSSSFDKTAI